MKPRKQLLRPFIFLAFSCSVVVLLFYTFSDNCLERIEDNTIYGNGIEQKLEVHEEEEEDGAKGLPTVVKLGDSSNSSRESYSQKLGACKIPILHVDGPDVSKFYRKFPPLNCGKRASEPWAWIDEERRVQPTGKARKIGLDRIKCTWAFYDRVNDRKLKWTVEESFLFGDRVDKGDFLKITCRAGQKAWTNPFMVVVPRKERVEELRKNLVEGGNASQPLNVYILSFDSLSQMSFRRNLPKTLKFLEEEMNSTVFNGYNIVGDGTPQAFIPILTGQTEEELPLTRRRYPQASYVDEVYPFLWRNYSKAGYATLYGEDGHELGTFTYRLKGFREKPTDHFPITFFHYSESLSSPRLCIGAEKQHVVWFRYIESFWREYKKVGVPRFSLMHHSCLSHDDINRVQQADEDLEDHLRKMHQMGAFEDSLVVIMADHGSRFSELRQTQQGQLEERLPFMSISFPNSADGHHQLVWKNLRKNALDRLGTPFDLHATLMDVLRWPMPEDELARPNELPTEEQKGFGNGRGKGLQQRRSLSLLREVPLNRTCDQAGIEPHWCTCLNWQQVGDSNETVLLARGVVKLINDFTRPERTICAKLKLRKVISAKKLVPNENLLKYSGTVDTDGFRPELKGTVKATFATYQIVFQTEPGGAKYEVTLFYDGKQINVDWTAISHINKYGDAPHCIINKNYFMAIYCVCYDKIAVEATN